MNSPDLLQTPPSSTGSMTNPWSQLECINLPIAVATVLAVGSFVNIHETRTELPVPLTVHETLKVPVSSGHESSADTSPLRLHGIFFRGYSVSPPSFRSFFLSRSASQPPYQVFAQVVTEKSESVVTYRILHRLSGSKSRRMSQKDNHPLLLGEQISSTIG